MFLSIVVPVFNEASCLSSSVGAIVSAAVEIGEPYEVLLVDDGSSDDSWSRIRDMAATESAVKGVRLSRNYGKEAAIFAGLSRALGQHVLVMDADMQHPPHEIPSMVRVYLEQELDVLDGVKRTRGDERFLYRLSADAFNRIFSRLTGMHLRNASDFKILSRQVVDSLATLEEKGVFFRGLTSWVGFKHGTYEYDVAKRSGGRGGWSVVQLVSLGVNAVTSYTASVLHVVSLLGFVFFLFAVFLGIQTLANKIAGEAVDGFTTVILLLLILGAAIMVSLGIVGQYIARIYEEVKNRPRFIIREEI